MFSHSAAQCFITTILVGVALCCLGENNNIVADTFELKEVVITDTKNKKENARISFQNLENYSARKLPNLLNDVSGIYLKSYGNGQLTTIAVRGTTSSQTEVLWNGIKLNSPMLGQSDFALLNIGFHNSIAIQYNQLNTAIGSNINLNNQTPNAATQFEGTFRAGSFGLLETNMAANYGNKKLRGSTKAALLKCENNFPILKNNLWQKQSNGEVLQWAFFQQLNYLMNHKNTIDFFVWFNNANRAIPPTLQQENSKAHQQDQSLRTLLRWQFKHRNIKFSASTAYLLETLQYTNYQLLTNDKSTSHAWRNIFQFNYHLKQFNIDATVFADYEKAISAGYSASQQRALSGISAKASYFFKQTINFSLGARQEFLNTKSSPFMPYASLLFSKNILEHFIGIELTGKRSFRFPTFNDLYWRNSGNTKLLPEESWNAEAAFSYKWKNVASLSVANFYAWINNQIQWTPDASGNWRPQNLKGVFAHGVDATAIFNLPKDLIKQFECNLSISYSYTRSTQTKSTLANDEAVGKQVIYVPHHKATTSVALGYYGFIVTAFFRYTGLRFISSDNSDALPAYSIADIELCKRITFSKSSIKFAFRINNIANSIYQDVADRPMPPRNFEGTISLYLK
jgi:iron complex outermembrane receptor protein